MPVSFSSSVIVRVVKDRNSDASKFSNFRPISLVTMFSEVLELCLWYVGILFESRRIAV